MADDITLPGTGSVVATDDVGSKHYQIVKVAWGADNSVTQTSATAGLPTVGASLSQSDAGLDANSTSSTGTALTLAGAKRVALQVDGATGTHATHIVKIQVSADGVTYHDSSATVTGEGFAELDTALAYARAKVTTAEGAASTIDIVLQAK
jgi:hypothetical protein